MTSTEEAQALTWINTTLNGDSVIQALASYDHSISAITGQANGIVWDKVAPKGTIRPFYITQVMSGTFVRTANERKRFCAHILILVKAVGESSQFATLDTMAAQADTDLSPQPDGINRFPIQLASGAWILSCVQTMPLELPYISAGKEYVDLGGVWDVAIKVK